MNILKLAEALLLTPIVLLALLIGVGLVMGILEKYGTDFYACAFVVDGKAFDCRILLEGRHFDLGKDYEVPIKFLHWELAGTKIGIGKKFILWEGKEIAKGKILRITKSGNGADDFRLLPNLQQRRRITMKPDIIARVRFYTTAQDGRKTAVSGGRTDILGIGFLIGWLVLIFTVIYKLL